MTADRLIQQVHEIAEAPDAIARLRRFILDLAVRGKLVEQDPEDEPALTLLDEIQTRAGADPSSSVARRAARRLISNRSKQSSSIPAQWAEAELGWVISLISGQHLQPQDYSLDPNEGIPYITGPSDFGAMGLSVSRYTKCRRAVARSGHLLITVKGSGVGKTQLCDLEQVAISRQLMSMAPIGWPVRYLQLVAFAMSQVLQESSRSAIPGISREDILGYRIALPPLAEQHRIVAKVDELMALCDELEAAQTKREHRRDRLVAATLHRLSNGHPAPTTGITVTDITVTGTTATEAPAAPAGKAGSTSTGRRPASQQPAPQASTEPPQEATLSESQPNPDPKTAPAFYLRHLAKLTTTPHHIKQLRQAILNLAVQGILVDQDPNDEPAELLLEKLTSIRGSSCGRRLRNGRGTQFEDFDSSSSALPKGWCWATFPQLGEFGRGKSKHRPRNDQALFDGGIYKMIQTGDVARSGGIISTFTALYNDVGLAQSKMWPKGTLCITIAANIADSGILNFDACFPDSVVGFVPFDPIPDARYFEYFLRTAKGQLLEFAPSTAQKNINLDTLEAVRIPLPPLAEQHRIVAKVNALMALCDELETTITHSTTTRTNLLESILQEALSSEAKLSLEASA